MPDLEKVLTMALQQGEHIILMLDGNTNMKQSHLCDTLGVLGFKEAIRHGTSGLETFCSNKNKTPIDGIWVSHHAVFAHSGYLDYDSIIPGGDHCCLWMDLSFVMTSGHNMPAITRPSARRLTCKDPRVIENYISKYEKLVKKFQLP
jgi:hypothetical protein